MRFYIVVSSAIFLRFLPDFGVVVALFSDSFYWLSVHIFGFVRVRLRMRARARLCVCVFCNCQFPLCFIFIAFVLFVPCITGTYAAREIQFSVSVRLRRTFVGLCLCHLCIRLLPNVPSLLFCCFFNAINMFHLVSLSLWPCVSANVHTMQTLSQFGNQTVKTFRKHLIGLHFHVFPQSIAI